MVRPLPHKLGRSQAVRQRILIPPCGGSNPPAPAIFLVLFGFVPGAVLFCLPKLCVSKFFVFKFFLLKFLLLKFCAPLCSASYQDLVVIRRVRALARLKRSLCRLRSLCRSLFGCPCLVVRSGMKPAGYIRADCVSVRIFGASCFHSHRHKALCASGLSKRRGLSLIIGLA